LLGDSAKVEFADNDADEAVLKAKRGAPSLAC